MKTGDALLEKLKRLAEEREKKEKLWLLLSSPRYTGRKVDLHLILWVREVRN